MKVAIIPPNHEHLNNKVFDKKYHRDNGENFFKTLKNQLKNHGIELNTVDFYEPKDIELIILFRLDRQIHLLPKKIFEKGNKIRLIYMAMEPSNISIIHNKAALSLWKFDRIFTWNQGLLELANSRKIYYSQDLPLYQLDINNFIKRKSKIVAIFSYKRSSNKKSNYSFRFHLIKSLSRKNMIDLYGVGWENCDDKDILSVYKGRVKDKLQVLQDYKYCLAIENECSKDYITEKLLDSISAGCLTVYFGANNVSEYFSEDLIIQISNNNVEELINKVKSKNENKFITARNEYLKIYETLPFNSIYQAKYITNEILSIENKSSRRNLLGILLKSFTRINPMRAKRYYWDLISKILIDYEKKDKNKRRFR